MTDIQLLNSLQVEAIDKLLTETFEHITSTTYEQYVALGKRNAELLGEHNFRFLYNGIIYPPNSNNTYRSGYTHIPTLHYSLLNDLDTINNILVQTDYPYIKNFFIAVISQSHNRLVLKEFLPTVLINFLKLRLGEPTYNILDTGVYGSLEQEPISVTRDNIQNIRQHYTKVILTLKCLLMDKLLLQ